MERDRNNLCTIRDIRPRYTREQGKSIKNIATWFILYQYYFKRTCSAACTCKQRLYTQDVFISDSFFFEVTLYEVTLFYLCAYPSLYLYRYIYILYKWYNSMDNIDCVVMTKYKTKTANRGMDLVANQKLKNLCRYIKRIQHWYTYIYIHTHMYTYTHAHT